MTFEQQYILANVRTARGKRLANKSPESLYVACKALLEARASGMDTENALILRVDCGRGRPVAFLSEWTETVRPFFSANECERQALSAWEGPQARPMD